MRYLQGLAGGLVVLCVAAHAFADSGAAAAAQALYDQGKKLMASGNFAEACPKLQDSQRLDPGGGTILLLARCHARQEKTATAWTEYQEAMRMAVRDNRKQREKLARDESALLEPLLAKIIIEVPRASVVPGLIIKRDGLEVGASQWSLAVAADPGRHEITVSAPGRLDWSKTVELRGAGAVVTVVIEPLEMAAVRLPTEIAKAPLQSPEAAPQRTSAASADAPTSGAPAMRISGAVIGGVGVVLVGVGAVYGVKAKSSNDRSHDAGNCTGNLCDLSVVELRNQAQSQARVSTVLVAVGAAALVGGAALWFAAPKADRPSVAIGLGADQLLVRGTW